MKNIICRNCGQKVPGHRENCPSPHASNKNSKKDLINCVYKMAEHISRQGCIHCPMERLGVRYCWGDCIGEIENHFLKMVKE